MERDPGESVFSVLLEGVDSTKRFDLRFFAGVTGSAEAPTKIGGDEIAGTEDDAGSDGGTETTTVWDTDTDVSEADAVIDADPETG